MLFYLASRNWEKDYYFISDWLSRFEDGDFIKNIITIFIYHKNKKIKKFKIYYFRLLNFIRIKKNIYKTIQIIIYYI